MKKNNILINFYFALLNAINIKLVLDKQNVYVQRVK